MRLIEWVRYPAVVAIASVPAAAQPIESPFLQESLSRVEPQLRDVLIEAAHSTSGNLLVVECNGFYGFGYETIQAAIDAAVDGDVVLVLPRNHAGIECDGDRYVEGLSFHGKAIIVTSATGPQHTIVDADDTTHVVSFENDEGPASVLHGFTLTNGNALPGGGGGGIHCRDSSPTISNCVVENCRAEVGGGIYTFGGDPLIRNCVIESNAAYGGAGVWCSGSGIDVLVSGCTIVDNATMGGSDLGGGLTSQRGSVTLVNSIVWGNTAERGPQLVSRLGATLTVAYCDVEGGEDDVFVEADGSLKWLAGNIDADPLFVDPDGDYHLMRSSPARNAGDPDDPPGGDETDIDGDPRILEGRVDMGADEYLAAACPADLDGSGAVDFDDLLAVLDAWGNKGGPEDLDGSGTVDFGDLLIVLDAWGPCE